MKHYIIDGNNLIGKIKALNQIQKKDKQKSREKLALMLSKYFIRRKAAVSLHFDGFENEKIVVSRIKLNYSGNKTADDKIKKEIESSKNSRNIVLVTSDSNLAEFGRVCSCGIIKSEIFANLLLSSNTTDEEQNKINEIDSVEEFKNLFGVQ